MSRYDLTIGGNSYAVEIAEVAGTSATVLVNGTPYTVDIPGGVATAAIPAPAAAPAAAPVAPAAPAPAPVAAPAAPAPAAPAAPAPSGGGEAVVAPMPGHILSVAVNAGDAVEVGDTVIVMEAMKMENEIKAHVAGTIQEILVSKGQDVGVNEALITIG